MGARRGEGRTGGSGALALCGLALSLWPLRAEADAPTMELGAGPSALAGTLEHHWYARETWPLQPGGHVDARVSLGPDVVFGASFDGFYRRIEGGDDPAAPSLPDPGRVFTRLPLAFVAGRVALGPSGWWLRASFGIGTALDRRRDVVLRVPANEDPAEVEAFYREFEDARATAVAETITLAASAPLAERVSLELEAGWLGLFYPRNPTWARYHDHATFAAGYRTFPESRVRLLPLAGTHNALVLRLTALVRLWR